MKQWVEGYERIINGKKVTINGYYKTINNTEITDRKHEKRELLKELYNELCQLVHSLILGFFVLWVGFMNYILSIAYYQSNNNKILILLLSGMIFFMIISFEYLHSWEKKE